MYIFVINPEAGNGRARRVFKSLQNTDTYKAINAHFIYTKHEGHATEIAKELSVSDIHIEAIIIVGGDGTIYEFLNGFTNRDIPLSFLLGGSGNDFARGCSIDGTSEVILKRVISGEKPITYWPTTYESNNEKRVFANSIGFGFDALVTKKNNQSMTKAMLNRMGIGKLSYVYSLIKSLIAFKPLKLKVKINGSTRELKNCWIASASNHPYVGGGIKLVPQATNNEDEFTVILIHSISRLKVILLFTTVFSGLHARLKEVEQIDTKKVEFIFENEVDLQVDGETNKTSACTISKQHEKIIVLGAN